LGFVGYLNLIFVLFLKFLFNCLFIKFEMFL